MTHRLSKAVQGAAHATAQGCPLPLEGVDLHLHSTFSDGLKTPDELCAMACRAGVSFVALCDHDNADGVPDMRRAAQEHGLMLIPGAEVSAGQGGRMHILCYGDHVQNAEMQQFLQHISQERIGRAARIMDRLNQLGVPLAQDRRQALLAMPSVGRAHIARELIAMGAVNTMEQAFDRYLASGRPAYVPRALLTAEQAVEKLRDMRMLPVLAHPMRAGLDMTALHALVRSLKACGLAGMEVYHPSANAKAARLLYGMAQQENLLVTGGSDYHGDPGSSVRIGRLPPGWNTRRQDVDALLEAVSTL